MNLGAFATIARMAPPNFMYIIWDNGQYQLTGGQLTATATVSDLVAMGKGAGIKKAVEIRSLTEFKAGLITWLSEPGPWLVAAKTDDSPAPARPPKDPVQIKLRFMEAISAQ
jgi:thiamine pyrophosphate-dependent acetolactate synthase large subunit-like protein